jgi:hypothetical protein
MIEFLNGFRALDLGSSDFSQGFYHLAYNFMDESSENVGWKFSENLIG